MPIQQMLLGLGAKDYEIERSLRFNDNDSAYLTRTPSSASNRKTFTFSTWVKRTGISLNQRIFTAYNGSDHNHECSIQFQSDNKIQINNNYNGSTDTNLKTDRLFRDPSAWYHIVVAVDMTQGTASDRVNLYVNGVQETSFSTENYGTQDYTWFFNNNSLHSIGRRPTGERYFDGYMTEIHLVDGSALTASSFGKTSNKTGQWIPKKYSGSYGTNGFYLNFSDNSNTTAATLGKDSSGNGHNFTPNNFSVTAGKDDDSSFDSPTNNFPTLSALDRSLAGTMSNGNLRVSYNYKPATKSWRATMALPSSGKFYWEWENEESSSNPGRWQTGLVRYTNHAGVVDLNAANSADHMSISFGGSIWNGTSNISAPGTGWPSFTFYSGERAAVAIDCSNGKWWLGKVASDGSTTWYDDDGTTDGNPAGGTNETATLPSFTTATEWMPFIVWHDGGAASSTTFTSNINFGNHSFLGTVPTGFEKLCSANLPDQTILLPNKHFEARAYTGTGAGNTQTLTGFEFAPDLVWGKNRTTAYNHGIFDTVRGASNRIYPNLTNAEASNAALSAFTSDGYTVGTDAFNENNVVTWNWKAGGSASSNSDGTITSSVSANTTAKFSIATYSGNSTAGATVGHGLGVKPDFIIIKTRNASDNWMVYHTKMASSSPEDYKMELNDSGAKVDSSNMLNDTAPTSSVVTLSADGSVNNSSRTYVMYCFSEVAGYSKFGSYTGNGNADGSFAYTGFRPAFILFKNSSTTTNWEIYDTARPYAVDNPAFRPLYANLSNSEETHASLPALDIVSNGFKPRSTWDEFNKNGDTIIYMAFAESPFKYSRAR